MSDFGQDISDTGRGIGAMLVVAMIIVGVPACMGLLFKLFVYLCNLL